MKSYDLTQKLFFLVTGKYIDSQRAIQDRPNPNNKRNLMPFNKEKLKKIELEQKTSQGGETRPNKTYTRKWVQNLLNGVHLRLKKHMPSTWAYHPLKG